MDHTTANAQTTSEATGTPNSSQPGSQPSSTAGLPEDKIDRTIQHFQLKKIKGWEGDEWNKDKWDEDEEDVFITYLPACPEGE